MYNRHLHRVLILICHSILLVSTAALAAPRKVPVVEGQYTTIQLSSGKQAACLKLAASRSPEPGKIKRKKGSLFFIPTDKREKKKLRALKSKIERSSGKIKASLKKKLKRTARDFKQKKRMCSLGFENPNQDPKIAFAPLKRKMTEADVRVLLERAAFGYGVRERAVMSAGLTTGVSGAVQTLFQIRPEQSGLLAEVRDWLDGQLENIDEGTRRKEFYGMRTAWLHLMLNTNNPFREKLALFLWTIWGGHESSLGSNERDYMWDYISLARDFSYSGDLKEFVRQSTISPFMLRWLKNTYNVKDRIHEQFAATYLDTFMLGKEGYISGDFNNHDITNIAKAFSGWQLVTLQDANGEDVLRPFFVSTDHVSGSKQLFSGTPNACTAFSEESVHACLFSHSGFSKHYARSLLKFFLTDAPSEDLTKAFAAVLRQVDYKIDSALSVLFESALFYDSFRDQATKTPIEFMVEFVRTLDLPVRIANVRTYSERMNMNLTAMKYPGEFAERNWMSHHHILGLRRNALNLLFDSSLFTEVSWTPQKILPQGEVFSWDIISYATRRLGVKLTPDSQTQIKFYMDYYISSSDGEFQRRLYDNILESHQWGKGRDIYRLLSTTPDFLLK